MTLPTYENGKVYRMYNTINEKFYIGSTTETNLNKRKGKFLGKQKESSKLGCEIKEIGWKDNDGNDIWIIEEIECYPCKSKEELVEREGVWQRKFFEESPELILNQRQEGDTKFVVQQRASKKYRKQHKEQIKIIQEEYRKDNKDILNAKKREKIICAICGDEISRNSMNDHVKSNKCQQAALEQGLITEIEEWDKPVDKDSKKEYDRVLYEKRKEEGYYERRNTGPRKYESCTWILKRATKDGKKAGDACGKNCEPKAGEEIFCVMHKRVYRASKS